MPEPLESLCECGCGERPPIATRTRPMHGHVKGVDKPSPIQRARAILDESAPLHSQSLQPGDV